MQFFFDTEDGHRRVADLSGLDLRGEDEAVEQAVALLRDLSHAPAEPGVARRFSVRVRDGGGEDLYAASLDLRIDRLR